MTETYVEKVHVPTCGDNVPGGSDVLCTAAVTTCPDEAEIRFWIFQRTVTRATGLGGPYSLVTDPTYVCLGPEEAALDPTLAIPSIVEREFKRVVVLKGVAEVSPRPDTLVNIPTLFATSAPASYDIPLMLLGQSVVITATAERYIWHVGDGASGTTSAPQGRLEHTYRRAASRQAYVVIEWSGTFSINGAVSAHHRHGDHDGRADRRRGQAGSYQTRPGLTSPPSTAPVLRQTFRRTVTTRPSTTAVSPGMGA